MYFKLDKSLNFLKQHSMQRNRCKRRHFAQHLFFKMVASILECYFLIKYVNIYLRRNLKNLIHKNIFVMYICGAWSTLLLIGSQLFVWKWLWEIWALGSNMRQNLMHLYCMVLNLFFNLWLRFRYQA